MTQLPDQMSDIRVNNSQLQTDVFHVMRLLQISMLRQVVMQIRKVVAEDERRLAYVQFKKSIDVYKNNSRILTDGGRDVLEILKIDAPRLVALQSKVVSFETNELVILPAAHATLVKLQSRLMFAEGYLPLLVKLLSNTTSQQSLDQSKSQSLDEKKSLILSRPNNWLSLTLQYENDSVAKLSRAGQVMACVEKIHQACLQLAQSTDNRLEFDYVDSNMNTLRFVGPADNIVALHGVLETLKNVRLRCHGKKTRIDQKLSDLPVFCVLNRMRHFGSVCPNILDESEAALKIALLTAAKLGIDPIAEPQRMKVRVAPSLEVATLEITECPIGTLDISARDEEDSLPLISVDHEYPASLEGLSKHVMHNIGRVSNSAEL